MTLFRHKKQLLLSKQIRPSSAAGFQNDQISQIDPAILHERLISRRKADASFRIVLLRGVKQLTFGEKAGESHTVKVLVALSACDDRSAWGRLEGEGLLNEDYIMH
ncbi:uncharacterized protein LOC111270841 [Varroa jacobsoni]|uniref:uncharacterized protein LOC111270841 n=1 Tax=Varroa jacobsoni TaxID=62625 RepID=UPI000BF82981|nr:uncharacterized protein LOC111270841 [Varroa jacobsoni]